MHFACDKVVYNGESNASVLQKFINIYIREKLVTHMTKIKMPIV